MRERRERWKVRKRREGGRVDKERGKGKGSRGQRKGKGEGNGFEKEEWGENGRGCKRRKGK